MNDRATSVADDDLPDGDPARIVRRAPFAHSPVVGERGQRAQARILEAGLEVFGEYGYHGCGIKRITEVSGYSRASFYQYFSSKEDLFRHLAGRVARLMTEAAESIDPITGDEDGRRSFAAWLDRWSEVYDEYEPVFVTFQTAAASDAMVASGAARVATRTFTDIRTKIKGSVRTGRQVGDVVRTLLDTVTSIHRDTEVLELAAPGTTLGRQRINLAFVDALHRSLFGPMVGVNVHTSKRRLRALAPAIAAPVEDGADSGHGPAALRTRDEVIEAGHRVFVELGYYNTRVADVVRAAGVSHGVFYRYFDNKAHLFRILAERAAERLSAAVDEIPPILTADLDAPAALRTWLGHYASTYAQEAAIFAMWGEAMARDDDLGSVSVNAIDNTRGRLARWLSPRGWGDPDADAMVLLALIDSLASRPVTAARVETIARMIEWGLLEGPSGR